MVKVAQLMNRELVSVQQGATAAAAAALMQQRKIGSIFILRSGEIVGIVTESDIVRKVVGAGFFPEKILVEEIMSAPIIGIEETRPLIEAADLMEANQTRHLAVTRSGSIVGVLSVRDLLRPVAVDEL
ncbi:MAG TPA: CBS domain-containing protein [Nitrospiraceae bacterium]|nr:CBS domain-containing protein [Nitrospiraceae bacterium]